MKNYWLSWYHDYTNYTEFEIHSPWWESGICGDGKRVTIVAAIQAESPEHAQSVVYLAYDKKGKKKAQKYPKKLEWRFCNQQEDDWSPFCDRFPKADWMKWTPLKEPPPAPPPETAEQLLDKIYHVLPNYAHANWPKDSLAGKIEKTIKQLETFHWKEVLNHVDTRSIGNGFASWLCDKLGKDFGDMYWEYLQSPEHKELEKHLMVPKKVVDKPTIPL